ncbi:hypothetical protein J4442_04710 [Candidatus Woesearchaeota archaeon]|nr:hypothetical protein [Candidatus Woesearchaeota archaeon]
MIIISDSSSLILLEKSGLLTKLLRIKKIMIPESVYSEVVDEGLKRNFTDAIKIDQLVNKKEIIVKKVKSKKEFKISLGKGEKEAIELYYQECADKIIVDDKKALDVCKILNIPYLTVHIILINLLKKKKINKKEAIEALDILTKERRYSSEISLYYYNKITEVN